MPTFSASSCPSVVGLYVDKFIDPAGQLSNLVILNRGSGYSSSNPPTIVINGGGGSGAQIVPVIVGGEIISVKFYHDPNLGDLRGSNYTSVPSFSFVGGAGLGASMTCSLSQNTTILGVPANENSFLQFCADQRINYLALYNMRSVNWGSNSSTNISSPGRNVLANFIAKARTSGITEVGAVTSGSVSNVDNILAYQNSRSNPNERFDWLNLEKEYWNGDGDINLYISRLNYMRQQATGGTPYTMGVEVYLGWPSYSDMVQMIPLIDRLLLHDYSSTNRPDFKYTRTRLVERIGSACTFLNTTLDVMPIFSAERAYSPWNADYEFMGLYYTGNTLYSSWYNWAVIPNGYFFGSTNLGSYNYETSPFVRQRINPIGQIVFDQSLLRVSNPPTLPSFTPFITANGPTTFNIGQSVQLTANPEGCSYYWQPNGQTSRTITVTGSGNYSVTVTNFSGVTSTSSAVTVTVLSSTCQADIFYSQPTTFLSGGSIILSANTGSTYYWLPNGQTTQNITVTESGNYQVLVSDLTGCTGTSQVLTVTVNPCQTTITTPGSLSAETGDVVFLYADPTALSYYWYPDGQTTSSIGAVNSGNYYASVNYGNGCNPTSNTISLTFLPCVANLYYTGSTTLVSGETLFISASTADAYYWSPNGETTQVLAVQQPGTYSVMTFKASLNCSAYSESVVVNVVSGTCVASIQASGPLYWASGASINSVTLTANSGATYSWAPNGETTQSIVVTNSGVYTVQVDNGFGCISTSSIQITANNYNPITGIWTEDNFPAVLNSVLSSNLTRSIIPWTAYQINLSNQSENQYYAFFRFRSTNGKRAGLRFAVNDTNNFIPITGIKQTTFGWYRIDFTKFPASQFLPMQVNYFYIQPTNSFTEIDQFAISSDPDFVPGPYPNYVFI